MKITHFTQICRIMIVCLFLLQIHTVANGGSLKNIGNGICLDQEKGLMWQIDKSKRYSDIEDVKVYGNRLNLGNYTDWRLPTTMESIELRGIISIQGNNDCRFPKLESRYWLVDKKRGTVPVKLELECFCRGDFNLVFGNKGYVRMVRDIK